MHDNEIFLTKLEITLEPKKKEKKIFDDEENFPETDSNELMNKDEQYKSCTFCTVKAGENSHGSVVL